MSGIFILRGVLILLWACRVFLTRLPIIRTTPQALHKPENGWFIVEIVGESFRNPDGQSRQKIISRLSHGDPVTFVPEPENVHSKSGKAVAVITNRGQIGYLPEDCRDRHTIFNAAMNGEVIEANVLNIVGGDLERPSRGVWVQVRKFNTTKKARKKKHKAQ